MVQYIAFQMRYTPFNSVHYCYTDNPQKIGLTGSMVNTLYPSFLTNMLAIAFEMRYTTQRLKATANYIANA